MEIIEVMIEDVKPVSTNDMYFPMSINKTSKTGRKKAILVATPELRDYHSAIDEYFRTRVEDPIRIKIKSLLQSKTLATHIEHDYHMPDNIFISGDASNYIKSTEDAIAMHFKVNDRNNKSAKGEKFLSPDGKWRVLVRFIFKSKY